ncbi:HELZ [Branchiostoma lanceolatum]|uniref:HELZ protein n=1 Tax=Branchiostoma lanceolatum TaxID=7740 RepID=A0A8K0EAT7_BRALA|nr:HELZ [Branchiostoma lanceolatum]
MGEREAALSGFEAALGIVNHFPNKPRSAVDIYWLRAQYCFDMAKELADNFIEEEEKERAKKKKIVCGATTKPKLKGKKKKKTRQVHTARTGNRDVTNDAEPEKHAEDLDVSKDSSDSCSSDSGHQEDKEEEDQDEVANWTTVRKHRPIPTHNRFNAPPAAGSAHIAVAGQKTFAARPKVKAAASHKHPGEYPPLMMRRPLQQQSSTQRVQPYKSPIQTATRPKTHFKPRRYDESTKVQPTGITLQDFFIMKKTPICKEAKGAEAPPTKRMTFSRYHEDIKAGTTTVRDHCDYCQLQCNSQQQLRNHYQGKKHRAKLLSDDSDQMWQQRRPPPGVPAGQYKMCPNRFRRCIHGVRCTYAHTEEELKEWQQRYEIRKQKLKAAQTSGRYGHTFAETLAEDYTKAKDKTKVLSATVQHASISVEPEHTSVMFPERAREYRWTLKLQAQLQVKRVAFTEGSCSQFKIKAVNSTSGQPLDGLLSEDGQEWISHGAQQLINTDFTVQITFSSNQYGSFHQAAVFDFGQRPFLFCPFHVDVAMETDLASLTELRSKFTLLGTSWEHQGKVVHYIDGTGTDDDVDEELRVKYQLPQDPQKLVNLKISTEDMLNKFSYRKCQHQLLFIEEAEQSEHIRRLTLETAGIVSNKMERVYMDSTQEEYALDGELYIKIDLNEALSEDTPQGYLLTRSLSPKAHIIIHTERVDQDAFEVWVELKTKNSIWLRIPSPVCQHFDLDQDTKVNMEVQFKLDRGPMLFRHYAVDAIKDLTLVFPDNPNVSKRFWKNFRKQSLSPPHFLNDKQTEAFSKIAAPTEIQIPTVLLIGPFGTGKTHTIAAAASAAAQQHGARILICTHSNSAADLYIRNFLKKDDIPAKFISSIAQTDLYFFTLQEDPTSLLRIYYKKRKKTTVPEDVLKHCIMNEDGTFRYPTKKEVAAAKIVITTLSLSLVLKREVGLQPGFFTHIMVDEAAQALECEAITPLSLATAKTRVVLAGDHMQLSPKVFSSFARGKGFHQSLLERLFYHYQTMTNDDLHPCITLLHENYRCHNDILKFPSKVFYGGKLICRSEAEKHPDPKFFPLQFFAVAHGQDSAENTSTSFYNDAEVWEVADRVEAVWNSWPETKWGEKSRKSMAQIGVVTPYQDQVNRIRLALRRKGLAGVTVETVTNVQGKEYRALFLSTVRTRATCCDEHLNPPQETHKEEISDFGFLSDPKLLNTAITRAKSFVGVVGDPVSLCSVGSCSKIWFEYIEDCSRNGGLHRTSVGEIKEHLNMLEMEAPSLSVASVLRPEAPIFLPRGVQKPDLEAQRSQKKQQEESRNPFKLSPSAGGGESKKSSPIKDHKLTCPISKSEASSPTALRLPRPASSQISLQHHPGEAMSQGMGRQSQASGKLKPDLISSAIQRQISKAESNVGDDLNSSSSSDSDDVIDIQTHGERTQDTIDPIATPYLAGQTTPDISGKENSVVKPVDGFQPPSEPSNMNEAMPRHRHGATDSTDSKTTRTPALDHAKTEYMKQAEATKRSTTSKFVDEQDKIVKELQKQVRKAEDPNYVQDREYEEEYPKPRETLGADEPKRPYVPDSKSSHGEQKGRVKSTPLFKLGTSLSSTSDRTALSIEGYSARYTYAEYDEEAERLRGGKLKYQKHFDENTLYELLIKHPDKYVKCRIQMSKAMSGQGHGVMEDPAEEDIQLCSTKRLNRAFDGDEVVVELDTEQNDDSSTGDIAKKEQAGRAGSVIGVMRTAVPREELQFVCYVDDHDPNVLIPVQKGAPKFQNVVPQDIKGPIDFIQLYSLTDDGTLKSKKRVPHHRVSKRRGLFVTRFLKWEPHFVYPLGAATRLIEAGDSEGHAVNVLMADHMIQESFTQQVLDHIDQMFPKDLAANDSYPKRRKDLTDLVAVTIDPPGARDLDDALSVCQLKNGKYEVSIHIADVSNFIKKGDPVDREALARGTSYYPHTAAKEMVPMLPPQLCTNLLSLIPTGEKYAITVCVEIDEKSGNISKRRFFPSKIRLKVQLTYQQAQSILNGEKVTREGFDRDVVLSIQRLGRISKILRTERLRELAFLRNDVDEDMACSDAHYLVEEFMILANSFVAEHVMEHFPYCTLLRRQLPPKDHRMIEWKETHGDTAEESLLLSREMDRYMYMYNALGRINDTEGSDGQHLRVIIIREIIWTEISQAAEDGDIQKLQMLVLFDDNHPQLAVAKGHYRRIQSRAVYVSSGQYQDHPEMHGHFSLNIPAYTHFTSPIRRYADIVVHRLLVAAMTGSTCPYEQEEMEELCAHLTQKAWNSKAFDKRVSLIKMAFEIQKKPIVQQPFIESIDGRRIHLNFPDCPDIPASNRTISMAHLQPDQQPTWIEGTVTVTFVWRPRIYDLSRFNPESYSSNRSLLPDDNAVKICTYTKRLSSSTWKAMVDAIRENDLGTLQQVVQHANQMEVHNDSEQQRLLEISRAETSTATGNLQRQRTQGVKEDHEDELLAEEEGNATGGSDKRGGEKSAAGDLRRYNKTFEVTYSPYDVIQVQLTTEMYRGLLTPTIQLLKLTPAVDICLEHRRDPVGVFATRTGEMASKESYDSLKQYVQLWRPVVEMEAANSSNKDEKEVTIMGIKIQWRKKRDKIHGMFQIPGQFARACCFLIRPGDQLCVRYANLDSTSDVINTRESEDSSTEESDDTFSEDSFESAYSAVEEPSEDAITNKDKEGPTWVAHCIVHEVTPRPVRFKERVDKYKITVRLHHHSADIPRCLLEPAFGARRSCTVEHIQVPVPIRRMRGAVEGLVDKSKESAILEEICINQHPERLQMTDPDLKSRSKDDYLGTLDQGSVHLNDYQKAAIQRALCCPFYVIQGPPGTGKTKVTGAHLAYKMAKRNRNARSGDVVMYCGPSNKSVDVVAEQLMDSGLKIMRVYSKRIETDDYPIPNYPRVSSLKKTSNEKLRNITLHHKIRQPGTQNAQQLREMEETFRRKQLAREPITDAEVDTYMELIDKASVEMIKGVEVLLCTCNMAGDRKITSAPVKQCIIDEAGMCMEPESLIPISNLPLEQVVLIGDHQQLQPIVSQPDARDLGLGVSLFERHAKKAYMLQIQYRMHEKICEFPSIKFYENKLETADSVKRRRPDMVPASFWPSRGNPVVFCHVEGVEEALPVASAEGGVMSQSNQQEVQKVVQIVSDLVVRYQVKTTRITVLSPYRAQMHQITESLKERKLDSVTVRTIVDSQGSEWDYVVLSTVRSLPQAEIPAQPSRRWMTDQLGFLTDDHQINVGLTRARRGFIIVGNKNLLQTHSTWSHLVKFYEKRGYLVDATEFP